MNPFAERDMTTAHFFFFPRFLIRFALSVAVTGRRYLIDATHAQAADAAPRRLSVQFDEIQLSASHFKRLDRIYWYELPAKFALNNFRFHSSNPHKARVLDSGEFAVGEALPDSAAHRSAKPGRVVALAGVESESLLGGSLRPL